MSWRTVAEGDLLDVKRSRLGWGVAITLFAFTAGIGILAALSDYFNGPDVPAPQFELIMLTVGALLAFILPFVAMLASYNAIVHERETGSVRFLLGLPNSRLDAYLGKYVSRSVVYLLATLVGLVVLGGAGFAVLREPAALDFLLFALATFAFGLVFVGFGLACSAIFDSETSVTSAVVGTYVLFRGGWMIIQWGGLYLTRPNGETTARPYPDWYFFLGRANPMNAYAKVVDVLFNNGSPIPIITAPGPPVNTVATSTEYAVLALVAWIVVIPVLGYLRFRSRDVL
ncbi:MAG: ABC transporter permease subunit [Haloarculaceae archaeon]